ncbi:nucleolin 1-like isoform X1 [Zingiber officinale]|uniref:nucleolin 1-like isoform X1 n=1 Tax=Zingiber officinale TaxID=94328 RepID=UPI001C4BCBCB|nr:nucleolin 1-like isoform X1 [Zingiber officinale]
MGESSKQTNVQVAPAVSALSGNPGKRGAEKVLDKIVIAKKQKKEIEMVAQDDIKAPQEVPSKGEPETNSSDDEFSSDSEEEQPAKTVSAPAKSDAFASKNGSVGAVTKRGEESSSSERDSDEDKEDIAEAAEKHTAPDTNLEKRQESYLFESDADEDDAFEGSSNSEESFEKSSDEESEDEKPLKIPNKNKDVKMKDAIVDSAQKQTKKSEKKVPKTSTVQNPTSGSQTLYVGNLSYDVGPHDLSEFFKGVGEVVGARLATRGKGSSKGFGHVDFATEEDVKKALELNGQEFFGRPLKLEVARGRDSNTPQSGNEKGSKDQSHTIFVKGFDKSLGQDKIRNSLQKHFGSCGEIARISVLKDHESGAPKGMAFVDFKDQIAFKKAFELNGSELDGYTLTIDEGKPKGDNSNGKGKGKGGGKFSGRGGGRGGRGDRGRGRGSGGRGKGRGGGRGGRGDRSRGRGSGGKSRGRGGAERNSSDG